MKRVILTTFAIIGIIISGFAQSLEVESMDEVVGLNSTAKNDYSGHITVKNASTNNLDVMCKRVIYNSSNLCAFDSAYFCWDLCYPAYIDQSIGTVSIDAGQSTNFFTGHAYSKTDGSSCVDSIRYTFWDVNNVNDSLSVVMKYSASAVFSVEERVLEISDMYPNPAATFVVVEVSDKLEKGSSVEMFNLLGSKVREAAIVNGRVELNVSDLHAGIYLVTINKDGKAVETRKVVVRH